MSEYPDPTIVRVDLSRRSYDMAIGENIRAQIGNRLTPFVKRRRVFILSDETVWALHGDALEAGLQTTGLTSAVMIVAAGEQTKNWDQLGELVNWLLDAGADRDDVLLAFGGGVVGDLTGLAASLMKRG
ncbi:MAG: 3-dehydroquinate synthase, partial [Henriciella sp.]|nr:3-dehydroquinate synthase [Henriciella sp.]